MIKPLISISILALSGCGSLTLTISSDHDDLVDDVRSLEAKASTLSISPSLPMSSTASLNGVMVIGVDLNQAGERTLGEFQGSVDFASATLSGSGSNFERAVFDASGTAITRLRDVSGTITADATSLSPNATPVTYGGALDTGVQVETVTGSGTGQFRGLGADMFVSGGTVTGALSGATLQVRVLAD